MKVWVLGRGYPSKYNNGLGSFEFGQARMLARAGAEVFYFEFDFRSVRHIRRLGSYMKEKDGVRILTVSFPAGGLFGAAKMEQLRKRARLYAQEKLVKRYGYPDIIHVHYPSFFSYELIMGLQEHGVKIVATEHWSAVQNRSIEGKALKNLKDFTEKADILICVSTALKDAVIELTKSSREIFIVPNLLNGAFTPVPRRHGSFRFITAGRLVPIKQYDKIAEAFLSEFGEKEDVSLTMIGGGEEFGMLRSMIASAGREEQIRMTGDIPQERVAELIAESDALVVFSELETFCVPVIEAWACGKPVIAASSTGVIRDHPDKRLGITVPCNDLSALKCAMRNMYESGGAYDPEWISSYAQKHFSEKEVCDKVTALYRRAAGS